MAKRTFTVSRIFPLGSYKNITLTNSIEVDEQAMDSGPVDVMRELIREIHMTFEEYRQYLKTLKGEE